MLLSVEVNNRRTIRLGRRFNKAVTNSLILEMSPMPRGGIRGFQKSGSLQSLQVIEAAKEDDSSLADVPVAMR